MRLVVAFVFSAVLVLGSGGSQVMAQDKGGTGTVEEEFEVEEVAVAPERVSAADVEAAAASDGILGIPEYRLVPLLGILTWLLMLAAVVSRSIKIRKYMPKLMKVHRYSAWAAFAVGTLHAMVVILL